MKPWLCDKTSLRMKGAPAASANSLCRAGELNAPGLFVSLPKSAVFGGAGLTPFAETSAWPGEWEEMLRAASPIPPALVTAISPVLRAPTHGDAVCFSPVCLTDTHKQFLSYKVLTVDSLKRLSQLLRRWLFVTVSPLVGNPNSGDERKEQMTACSVGTVF